MTSFDGLLDGGVDGRTILVRSDLNVPLDTDPDGAVRITDDGRIRASLPTIAALVAGGARVVVTAHLGRPRSSTTSGKPDPAYSLAPVAERLAELLDTHVAAAADVVGDSARAAVAGLTDGGVALLENVRFDPRETSKDAAERAELADELVALAGADGAFVSDGFGVLHRAQASVVEVAQRLPAHPGRLVVAELDVLRRLVGDPARPYAVVLGGSKVSDKLAVIEALLPRIDSLLVGGGMCFTLLAARGVSVGDSLLEADRVDDCRRLLESAGDKIVLPADVVVATEVSEDAETRVVDVGEIPDGWKGLDIGPQTVTRFAATVADAGTVFWNGPMGVFELAPFSQGTWGVAQAIATAPAFSVVGGGDSAAAVRALGIGEDGFSHISTGGGASLEFLEGRTLPGVAVLEQGAG